MQTNPWFTLWIKPKATFQKILNASPTRTIIPLAIFHGILGSIIWLVAFWKQFPQEKGEFTPWFFVFSIASGIIIAFVALYLGSLLLKWIGKWFGGKGSYINVKSAVGWSNYPFIISGIFGLIALLLLWRPILPLVFDIIKSILFIWGVVIFVKMLAVAHKFSSWKALLTLIIGVIIAALITLVLIYALRAII